MDNHDYIGDKPAPPSTAPRTNPLKRFLHPLAALRLTIALFAVSLILVFFGTLAQKYDSLNTVLTNYFHCWVAWLDLNLLSDFTQVFFSFRFAGSEQNRVTFKIPFIGGFTLGWLMVLNLTAAHLIRFKISWKRAGIWILHAGVIVLLIGEYVRAKYAHEDRMVMREGQSRNFLVSLDHSELVFMTSADGKTDHVISIPGQQVEKAAGQEPIRHDDLPFDVKVVQYMKHTTDPLLVANEQDNLANSGMGRFVRLQASSEISSIRGGGRMNAPGCYVTLLNKKDQQAIGTYVLGYNLDDPETITHEQKTWRFAYRPKRTYLPYSLQALKIERVDWPNSNTPKEYKSLVKLDNPTTGEQRDVLIEMNSPLRYAGCTFYQSSMDFTQGITYTGFQVVRNPGSTLPYIACMLITIGMCFHFLLKLQAFLAKRARTLPNMASKFAESLPTANVTTGTFKRNWGFAVGVTAFGLLLAALAAKPRSQSNEQFDLDSFGRIPVQFQGRGMPLDSFARHHMLVMSGGRQSFKKNKDDSGSEPAVVFLLDLMSDNSNALEYPVIRIVDLDVLQYLRLKQRPGWWRYSFLEVVKAMRPKLSEIMKIDQKARSGGTLTDFESSLRSTYRHVGDIRALQMLGAPALFPHPNDPHRWLSVHDADLEQEDAFLEQATKIAEDKLKDRMRHNPAFLDELMREFGREGFEVELDRLKKQEIFDALQALFAKNRGHYAPQADAFAQIVAAYGRADKQAFNQAVADYHAKYVPSLPQDQIKHTDKEFFLNQFDPFFLCQWLYVGVMLLAIFSWLGWGMPLNNAASALAILTVFIHSFALILRMVISEKPPVTNLYSSAVFIGWGCVLLGIGMDLYFRNGIANFIAGLLGMGTMLIARFLEANGDTMPRVDAVLNTSFWLSTHVTIVTLGYTATYVAAKIGLIYIIGAMFTNAFRGELAKTIYGMMYGVTCFATVLSFVGTVLGGFWADDSWGRFWGWDPKENGAVIIVIWNTLILHMRWAGMIKARGFAIMALLGTGITTWSWFGTNQLGLGLHAYGFDKNLAQGCALCWIAVGLVSLLGFVPAKYWASFGPEPTMNEPRERRGAPNKGPKA